MWSKKDGPFGKEFPVPEAPTPDVTGSRQRDVARWTDAGGPIPVGGRPIYSSLKVTIFRINSQGVVKRLRRISDSPTNPDAEGNDELDGEEVEVLLNSIGHQSSTSPSHPGSRISNSQVILSTPRNFQQVISIIPSPIPPPSPNPSTSRPTSILTVRPSPLPQLRISPILTSQQLKPVASSSRRREGFLPLPFPATQVFQQRECFPIQVTREDPNMANEGKNAVASLFRKVERNSREVITYTNDRMIPGTASEEMAAKFAWYEDELINDFQITIDDLGRYN
ncbi:hypothetical protein O181_031402 [Austropuccinia psidii MF-1]|uniref:Uncharacterized protein n=1 Tax=Austropuccinia psidii MF-1 TaxID=1389203 RepID=A0A9Q3D0K6_9BASI|nr:hypothetical protein [Austropuccinia psidii MF-1]